jgi:cation diffusion facilitator CzcD-associated flavoprotein CzcO
MVIVVGAGPSGLATAYYLQQQGIDYCVLDKEAAGATWQYHYDRLHLHTLKDVSALPGLPMPADYPRFPSAAQFHAYLQQYARHFGLAIEQGVEVLHADRTSAGWLLHTNQGQLCADALVLATGIWNTPVSPTFAGQEDFEGRVLHVNDYRNPEPFRGQQVLVVGVGNSGAEIAVDLSEHGVTTAIAVRTGSSFAPHPGSAVLVRLLAWFFRHAPRALSKPLLAAARRDFRDIGLPTHPDAPLDYYPVIGYGLPDAVRAGKVTVYGGIERFVPQGVRFVDGREASFDSVLLATGYRPTVQFVQHELERGTDISPPLFCVGFTYPVTEGFLQSIGREARATVQQVAAALRAQPPKPTDTSALSEAESCGSVGSMT